MRKENIVKNQWHNVISMLLIMLFIILINQNSFAAEKGRLHIVADKPGAWVYLNGQKKAMVGDDGFAKLILAEGEYSLYIEKPIKNSPFAYRTYQEVVINPEVYNQLNLTLSYGFSKVGAERWGDNQKAVIDELLLRLEMITIPAGSFTMGSQESNDEKPPHTVNVASFKMAKYETTFNLYDLYVLDTAKELPGDNGWGRGSRPVINVSWEDAQNFITWLNKVSGVDKAFRLPSEAEWEYAARAGTDTHFWWGDNTGKNNGNCDGCGSLWDDKSSAPVGSFNPNPFGLMDTAGNVYEWVQDCWNNNYEGAPNDGSAWEKGNCTRRVLRGGSWNYFPSYMRSADRDYNNLDYRGIMDGFRLAQDYE